MFTEKYLFRHIFLISFCFLSVTSSFETWGMESKRPGDATEFPQKAKKPKAMGTAGAPLESSPRESDKEDSPPSRRPLSDFADPTRDIAFKHLLSVSLDGHDPSIASSFLNAFVPDFKKDPILELYEQPLAVPALARRSEKLTFMDFHVRTQSGIHIIIEMQVRRHAYFDERALFYAASVFSRQISEKELEKPTWYKGLMPLYVVQILGYDSNRAKGIQEEKVEDTPLERVRGHPMHPNQFIKHFKMTDHQSGQTIDHLQMIQIELPRAKKELFPPKNEFSEQDWWLSLFKHATDYKSADLEGMVSQGLKIPDVIVKALERLKLSKWVSQLVHAYKKEVLDPFDEYAMMFAVERAEGREEGRIEVELKRKREIACKMIAKNASLEEIMNLTGLSKEEIEGLRSDLQQK